VNRTNGLQGFILRQNRTKSMSAQMINIRTIGGKWITH